MPSKYFLRNQFRSMREELIQSDVVSYAWKIHDLLFSRIMMHRFDHIHTYLPIETQHEVDTKLIIQTLRRDFAPDIYLSKSHKNGILTHHLFKPETELIMNKWGIPEPKDTTNPVPETIFDLVFVPLLAFDKRGHRVGYGGGYYDRFLSKCDPDCIKIGLSFFEPVDEVSDINEFDIRLNHCITPNKIWTF